jgi:hypothetical protein
MRITPVSLQVACQSNGWLLLGGVAQVKFCKAALWGPVDDDDEWAYGDRSTMMSEPKKSFDEMTSHEWAKLQLGLVLDGIRYRDLFGRAKREPDDPKEKASRSWKGSVRVVGKGE